MSNNYKGICIVDYKNINDKIFNHTSRVNYYLGNLNSVIYVPTRNGLLHSKIVIVDEGFKHKKIDGSNAMKNYFKEMCNYYDMFKNVNPGKCKFLFVPGDVERPYKFPVLCKSKPCYMTCYNVLLPYNIPRHWLPVKDVKLLDKPFELKKDVCVWRGSSTGKEKRIPLVYNFFDDGVTKNNFINQNNKNSINNKPDDVLIDVGFTNYTNDYIGIKSPNFLKNRMSMKEMLSCKYIISIEGNDVASNLKWILSSQSVCIKPSAIMASWMMENKLIPWIHYIPVEHDFSDLKEKLKWCKNHPEKCKQIIRAANDYMKRFNNDKTEKNIILEVLNEYHKKVKFV